jgi:methylenetetrahydrofolate dehydrogenase (NADP+)/methenyltetrahydrofolate cyclohydrolase
MGLSNIYGVPGLGKHGAAKLIDGKAIAAGLRGEIGEEVRAMVAAGRRPPGLATILVGEDPASQVYVGAKHKACAEAGIRSVDRRLPDECTAAELTATIVALNADPEVDGILLQLPLPDHLEAAGFIDLIDPGKDVDGLSTASVGALWRGRPGLGPCTPSGVIELLRRAEVEISGAEAVIVGRSDLVGRPLAAMLLAEDATVTICHSRTRDLAARCRQADILIAALGRPQAIGADHVKPGAAVIDVGINRTEAGIVGDVDFEAVARVAGAITPVPGGVGPMTIALLLRNTVTACAIATENGH